MFQLFHQGQCAFARQNFHDYKKNFYFNYMMKVLPLQTTDDIYRNSQKFPLNFWWQHATKVLDFEKSC